MGFDERILPDNIPGLFYLAKISTKPYILAKGPDVTNVSIPSTINYHPNTVVPISITVSDDELSAGPGNYATSTQDIASINISVDMHPYDVDSNGNSPQIATFPFTATPATTWTKSVNAPFSILVNILKGALIGEHIIYSQGTDSDGHIGPVEASSFTITCIDATSIPINGQEYTCAFLASK